MERITEKELRKELETFLWVRYTAHFNMNKKSKKKIADGDERELQKLLGRAYNDFKEKYGIIDSSYLKNYMYHIANASKSANEYFEKMLLELMDVSNHLKIEKNTIKFTDKNFWDVKFTLRAINQLYKLNIDFMSIYEDSRFCQPGYIKIGKISIRLYKDMKTVKITKLK